MCHGVARWQSGELYDSAGNKTCTGTSTGSSQPFERKMSRAKASSSNNNSKPHVKQLQRNKKGSSTKSC
jgi:hypothetical protein